MTSHTPTSKRTPTASISSIVWSVPSASTAGLTYEVRAESATGVLFCNCLAAAHQRVCWHVRWVAQGKASKPVVRATVHARPVAVGCVEDLYTREAR
jgi:hypothetical protein